MWIVQLIYGKHTLPETNIFAPENGWLEYDRFGMAYFQGRLLLVSGGICVNKIRYPNIYDGNMAHVSTDFTARPIDFFQPFGMKTKIL